MKNPEKAMKEVARRSRAFIRLAFIPLRAFGHRVRLSAVISLSYAHGASALVRTVIIRTLAVRVPEILQSL